MNLSVVGLQWGDEGKGKVVDYLAGQFDAVARFNGGSNAGHTVVLGTKKHTFHLVPSGALKGKELLIGPGVALDPVVLKDELSLLPPEARGRMLVDGRATLVSPLEKKFDALLEKIRGASALGTTMRGIGPAYAMRAFRLTPVVSDLLAEFDFSPMEQFYVRVGVDPSGLQEWAADSRKLVEGMVGDVGARVVEKTEGGGAVLFEASQGTLLDLLHGSYPYVTSSHTVSSYIPASLGIPPRMAGEPLGVMKCYTTRVGSGPFPTELDGTLAETIRKVGNEYGATTGRPRRVGWLDLVALKYAVRLNGVKKVAISKLDVLSEVKEFMVCVAYERLGSQTTDFQKSLSHLGEVRPVLAAPLSLYGSKFGDAIPPQAKKLVDYVEAELGVEVSILSHGEERASTIVL
ncbi:MAG: adenylosuccinate synthetase [Thaumarchaeota archaeon]|nr:adenylosuccinate synthetase [Nitrososphaerota archaeon]